MFCKACPIRTLILHGVIRVRTGRPVGVQPRQGVILTLCSLSGDGSSPWGPNRGPFGVLSSAAPVSKPFPGGSGVKGAIFCRRRTPQPSQTQVGINSRGQLWHVTLRMRAHPKLRPAGDIMAHPPSNPTNVDSELVSSRSTFRPLSRLPFPV